MKVSEMNKEDLYNYMRASHEIHRFDMSSAAWKRAFKLARQNGYENIEMDCSKCVAKVAEWLKK